MKGALPPNAVTVQNTKWAHAFAETPTVVGWYANDNIYSCAIGSVTTTGCTISIKNVGEQANGIEGRVYAVAYITLTGNFSTAGNTSVIETIPAGFRPMPAVGGLLHGSDNGGDNSFYLWANSDGSMLLNGSCSSGRFVGVSGCWLTGDPMPV